MVLDRNEREFNPLRIFEEIAGRRWEETENDHATCEKNKEALNAEIKQHLREISMGVIKITKWSTIVNTNGTLTNTLNTDPRCIQGFTVEVKRKEEALLDNPYGSITEIKLAEYHRDDDFRRVIDTVVRFRFTGTEDSEVDFDASLLSHLNNPELNSPLTRLKSLRHHGACEKSRRKKNCSQRFCQRKFRKSKNRRRAWCSCVLEQGG